MAKSPKGRTSPRHDRIFADMPKILTRQKIILVIFGLVLCVVLLELGLRLGGFIFLSLQEYKNRRALKQRDTFRIMCLGESTTFGYQESYPSQLQKILNERNIGINFSVINKGVPGTSTSAILTQLEENLNKYQPDMVTTMMGINDGEGDIPYKGAYHLKTIIYLKNFRVYKLVRLLWIHIKAKLKELGISKSYAEPDFYEAVNVNRKKDEKFIRKSNGKKRKRDWTYVKLGWLYKDQGKYDQAEQMFKKAIEADPLNDWAYIELSQCYRLNGRFPEAEQILKKSIEFNPQSDWAHIGLGWRYSEQGKYEQAEPIFKKSIGINPKNIEGYIGLGRCYIELKEHARAEEMFKKAIEINPRKDMAYRALAMLYESQGRVELAKEYLQKADDLRGGCYNPQTRYNYQRLKEILDKIGIKLVCVQYPMRSIEPLKKMFDNTRGVVFVDNEQIFREAVRQEGYDEYFIDKFAGDFGHCTLKGNRLLAKNIAEVILSECFNK